MNHLLRTPHKSLLLILLFVTTQSVAAQPLLGIFPKGDKPGGALFAALVIVEGHVHCPGPPRTGPPAVPY